LLFFFSATSAWSLSRIFFAIAVPSILVAAMAAPLEAELEKVLKVLLVDLLEAIECFENERILPRRPKEPADENGDDGA
jgi:hypothetical protein